MALFARRDVREQCIGVGVFGLAYVALIAGVGDRRQYPIVITIVETDIVARPPWRASKRVRLTRGFGTKAASRAMTNRQDCRFGRPRVARRVAHRDVRHQFQWLEDDVRGAVSVRRLQLVPDVAVRRQRQAFFRDRRERF